MWLPERGLVGEAESRRGGAADERAVRRLGVAKVAGFLGKGAPTLLPAEDGPWFALGARGRVKKAAPAGQRHAQTRAPRYTQAREGAIARHHGAHIYPDRHAAAGEKQPRQLYRVRFEGREPWGAAAGASASPRYADPVEP